MIISNPKNHSLITDEPKIATETTAEQNHVTSQCHTLKMLQQNDDNFYNEKKPVKLITETERTYLKIITLKKQSYQISAKKIQRKLF